jgi:hypothetical protein
VPAPVGSAFGRLEAEQVVAALVVEHAAERAVEVVRVEEREPARVHGKAHDPRPHLEPQFGRVRQVARHVRRGTDDLGRARTMGAQASGVQTVDHDRRPVGGVDHVAQPRPHLAVVALVVLQHEALGHEDQRLPARHPRQRLHDRLERAQRAESEVDLARPVPSGQEAVQAGSHDAVGGRPGVRRRVGQHGCSGAAAGGHRAASGARIGNRRDRRLQHALVGRELLEVARAAPGAHDRDQLARREPLVDQPVQRPARLHVALEGQREIVDHDRHRARLRARRQHGRSARRTGRSRCRRALGAPGAHVAEVRDRALLPVLRDLEVVGREVDDLAPLLVGHDRVDLHELDADGHDERRALDRGLRQGRRRQNEPDGPDTHCGHLADRCPMFSPFRPFGLHWFPFFTSRGTVRR